MVRPLRLALFAGATALGAATFAAGPASAQIVMPWGLWSGPSHVYEDDDDLVVDRFIPPRIVSRIVAAQGYRLAGAPRLSGDTVVAIGQNARGDRVRFVIDGYSGQLLRRTALNGRENFARRDPDAPIPEALIPGAPLPRLDAEPPRKAKPKPKPQPKTAARKPTSEPAPKPQTPAPSQAIKEPAPPAPQAPPAAPEPAKAQAPQPEAPKAQAPETTAPKVEETKAEPPKSAAAPQPADSTPLAPDAAPAAKPVATPAPQQAAVPTTPATPDKPPLTPETKAPETRPTEAKAPETKTSEASPAAEASAAKPADIGPRVVPVARPPETGGETKPADKAAP